MKVKRGFNVKDFKVGQFVVETDAYRSEDPVVLCVAEITRSDGILPCCVMEPPFQTMRYPRAADMEPFYGEITFESKP